MSTTNQKTWLGNLLAKIGAWITGAKDEVHDLAVIADNLANVIKKAEASTIVQTLETTVEMIIPASTGLVNAFKLYWPKLVTVLNLAVAETNKTDTQIMVDGAQALAVMKGLDPNAYAGTMNTIASMIKQWFDDNMGLAAGTMQTALITQQLVHDPSLASILNIPSVDVTNVATPIDPATNVANAQATTDERAIDNIGNAQAV